jgi:hypothetical protein
MNGPKVHKAAMRRADPAVLHHFSRYLDAIYASSSTRLNAGQARPDDPDRVFAVEVLRKAIKEDLGQ